MKIVGLEEHVVLTDIERHFLGYGSLPENVRSIFAFAFSEMLNNAIDHSRSKDAVIAVGMNSGILTFTVDDAGIGVFRNVMTKRDLHSELEAIQDLLKGKTTTAPRAHSGEGIFFTSKVADTFKLESYGRQLVVDNLRHDIAIGETRGRPKKGTRVTFSISGHSARHLNDVFRRYTSDENGSGIPAFNKTEIVIRLYETGGVFVSRSQARRILSGLEKFRVVILDFDRVPMVGQAFADEIFRVFALRHPHIVLRAEHANKTVRFMIDRVEKPGS
jgi:anti-sigma regulatory factor (Ser/Thr protein kinase)